jgi:hypothetical protein
MIRLAQDLGAIFGTIFVVAILVTFLVQFGNRRTKKAKRLNMKQKKGWLIAHILFVMLYTAGVLAPIFITVCTYFTTNRALIYAAQNFAGKFDWFLIIPGAMGCLITGIWLAVRTHWGFTDYYWVIAKWVGNIFAILFGGIFVRMWIHAPLEKLFPPGVDPLHSLSYLENRNALLLGLLFSFCLIIGLIVISYLKPWGKVKEGKANRS